MIIREFCLSDKTRILALQEFRRKLHRGVPPCAESLLQLSLAPPPANRLSAKGGFPFPIARFLLVLHCARVGEEFGYFSGGLHDIITDFRHKRLNGPETQPGDAHGVARIAFLVEHRRGDAYQMGGHFLIHDRVAPLTDCFKFLQKHSAIADGLFREPGELRPCDIGFHLFAG